ncbi:agamous-like MADS-box protein AGL61 [Neltuma alba]|uniref:agamous-like MADS-box protein AGL61 n=1 Tax=Neltuma alba TaxID=207710 RepID=UPI0010A38FB5|nr:agamous-like MADS-box protein AGL61 [Prosopis alba]
MGAGKRNTEIKKIENKSARYVCFSKRREGLFKKAQQYHKISGSLIAVLVFSPTGRSYVHGSPSFDPIIDQFLHSSTAASMTTMTAAGTSSTGGSCMTEPSVSDSASTTNNVGLREQLEAIKLEGCDSLEELVEMKRKLEEVRETVLCSFADSLIS